MEGAVLAAPASCHVLSCLTVSCLSLTQLPHMQEAAAAAQTGWCQYRASLLSQYSCFSNKTPQSILSCSERLVSETCQGAAVYTWETVWCGSGGSLPIASSWSARGWLDVRGVWLLPGLVRLLVFISATMLASSSEGSSPLRPPDTSID